jgi:hypothetical protein
VALIKRGLFVWAIVVGLGVSGSPAALAKSHGPNMVDPTTIAPCTSATTTLAASNTIYTLTSSFSTTFTGICIKVTGSNDLILLSSDVTITGPGAGTGIDIEGSNDTLNGRAGTVSGFAIGVLDHGRGTLGEDVDVTGNVTGLELTGRTVRWVNVAAFSNTGNGIWFNACTGQDSSQTAGCTISDFFVGSNGLDGLLINNGSNGASAAVFISMSNTGNGVHVGGSTAGTGNSEVVVDDAAVESPTIADNGLDGIFLDTSENGAADTVTGIIAGSNTGIDLHDATTNCGSSGQFNLWSSLIFGTSKAGATTSPTCIPQIPNL